MVPTAASLGKGGASPYLQLPASDLGRPGSGVWISMDPRTASTQSLVPSDADDADFESGLDATSATPRRRRTLLIVYIHGFYGNAQSFRSFPAHVHAYLKTLLSETHVIHSKIYPRYKCYRAIEVARDNFSAWLEPHTSPTTDVVLVGHSMGGLLAAEVVLMPNQNPYVQHPFKHRILGTVALDAPFLGLHPGIIVSGISSLFQPAAGPPPLDQEPGLGANSNASVTTMGTDISGASSVPPEPIYPPERQPTDPFFNPPYFNDTPFREQPFVKRLWNFANKHKSEGIFNAVRNHVTSHMEFASCMADYPGMSSRYHRLRALEDVDEVLAISQGHPKGAHARVRFINYYTLSSGRPKLPKSPDGMDTGTDAFSHHTIDSSLSINDGLDAATESGGDVPISSPRMQPETADTKSTALTNRETASMKNEQDTEKETLNQEESYSGQEKRGGLDERETQPLRMTTDNDLQEITTAATTIQLSDSENEDDASLLELPPMPEPSDDEQYRPEPTLPEPSAEPPLPEPPIEPSLPDPEEHADKEARKQVEKERKRLIKAHEKAVKEYTKALREREKLIQKAKKDAQKAQKEAEKAQKEAEKAQRKKAKTEKGGGASAHSLDVASDIASVGPGTNTASMAPEAEATIAEAKALEAEQPKKQRKFCRLPSKQGGVLDPTWVDIYIDGVDEVGAHCGLFNSGPHYDKLVGDTGSRILGWVQDDLTRRAIMDSA
jgi:pimeloyl-ACP methyl ester carboxylesterase